MKRITKPGSYLFWKGELVMVTGIADGRTIYMSPVDKSNTCDKCKTYIEYSAIEGSPQFETEAESINTLEE